jgi:alanine racemase
MSQKPEKDLYRTWIEISSGALKHNYKVFRSFIGQDRLLLGVIKSNAYGHGLMTMARAYGELGMDWIGVDSIAEAKKLRSEGIKAKILVLGYTQPANFKDAVKQNISLTVSSFENLQALSQLRRKIKVHVKVDTGMHRQGFPILDLSKAIQTLKKSKNIIVEGLYTHFAAAKDPKDVKDTKYQIDMFEQAVIEFGSSGFTPICHAAATGGVINFPNSHFDMVRVGIGMYGLWPSEETQKAFQKKFNLKPVLSWKTIISEVKWVVKGERIGYNFTEKLTRMTKVAVLPIGYWHGYWRAFSSRAHVLVRGQRCRVLGRVSMDMVTVDVTDVPNVKVGDEVILIGRQGKNEITADELGYLADTSNYEIVTRLNPLIKKYYL